MERPAIKTWRREAEALRRKLIALDALDNGWRPRQEGEWIYFPVKPEKVEEVSELGYEVISTVFEAKKSGPRNLKEALETMLPPELLEYIPSSYDLVGDIVVLELPRELEPYAELVGKALMRLHPKVKTVVAKIGGTKGDYRLRELKTIAGTGVTETIHREHGCIYRLDLRKAFFNPRLGSERLRVARQVKPGERIADMFAGVGPFSILIAKLQPSTRIIAVELNPEAYRYLVENIKMNKVEDRVEPRLGDARKELKEFEEYFDRAIMDLPRRSLDFLDVALKICRENAMIHVYWTEDDVGKAVERVIGRASMLGYRVSVVSARKVMEVAPYRYTVALDLVKKM